MKNLKLRYGPLEKDGSRTVYAYVPTNDPDIHIRRELGRLMPTIKDYRQQPKSYAMKRMEERNRRANEEK